MTWTRLRALAPWAAGAFLVAYFFWFAGDALGTFYTPDDAMNIHRAWIATWPGMLKAVVCYWSQAYRPAGAILLRVVFDLGGFRPVVLHVVCFAFLLANLRLAFVFVRGLTNSVETALLACLLLCYHARFVDLYYNGGAVYDILCFFFYFLALGYYLRIRESGAFPGWSQGITLALCYILALDSKEMAVSLAVVAGLYELLWHPPKSARWLVREGRAALAGGLLTVPYILGKTAAAPANVLNSELYRPVFTLARYLDMTVHYADQVFYRVGYFDGAKVAILFGIMLALALVLRSRAMVFSLFFVLVTQLPVSFIAQRSAFVVYVPMAGWVLYFAELLARVRSFLFRPPAPAAASQAALFLGVAYFLYGHHAYQKPWSLPSITRETVAMRQFLSDFAAVQPSLPNGAVVLLQDDRFAADDFTPVSLLRLYFGDKSLVIHRQKPASVRFPPEEFGFIFIDRDGKVVRVK